MASAARGPVLASASCLCCWRHLGASRWEKRDALHPTSWLLERRQGTPLQAQEFQVCLFSFPRCGTDGTGNTPCIPPGSPLGCILRSWDKFDPESLKKETDFLG